MLLMSWIVKFTYRVCCLRLTTKEISYFSWIGVCGGPSQACFSPLPMIIGPNSLVILSSIVSLWTFPLLFFLSYICLKFELLFTMKSVELIRPPWHLLVDHQCVFHWLWHGWLSEPLYASHSFLLLTYSFTGSNGHSSIVICYYESKWHCFPFRYFEWPTRKPCSTRGDVRLNCISRVSHCY